MNADSELLRCWAELRLAARIDTTGTAKLLGFAEHDVPVLMASGMLKPLGNPAQNAPKWFASIEILSLVADRVWLDKATKKIGQHWLRKRQRRSSKSLEHLTYAPGTLEFNEGGGIRPLKRATGNTARDLIGGATEHRSENVVATDPVAAH